MLYRFCFLDAQDRPGASEEIEFNSLIDAIARPVAWVRRREADAGSRLDPSLDPTERNQRQLGSTGRTVNPAPILRFGTDQDRPLH